MSDRLFLRDLVREVEIGVHAGEHGVAQRLKFDITVEIGRLPEGLEDDLPAVLNYERFAEAVDRVAAGPRLKLVESFAERVAALILGDVRARAVTVRIEKLDILPGAAAFGVEITRHRGGGG